MGPALFGMFRLFCIFTLLFILSFFFLSNDQSSLIYIGFRKIQLTYDDDLQLYEMTNFSWCPNNFPATNLNIDCQSVFAGDKDTVEKMKAWRSPCSFNDSEVATMTENCTTFKKSFTFWSLIKEREDRIKKSYSDSNDDEYPLAFVIIGPRNGEQFLRLFQSIYLQKNLYCLTYDNKSSDEFKKILQNLDKCYENVLMPNEFVDIWWAGFSILESAMNCLKVLIEEKNHKWKYVQIVSYNDYPLRTNEEMVKMMKIFNGSQDSLLSQHSVSRSRKYYKVNKKSGIMNDHLHPGKEKLFKRMPPGNLIEYKGSLATTMSREFVEFMFQNIIAQQLYMWSNTTYMAEEIYFSTLIHNLHINPPGGFPGACERYYQEIHKADKPYISRYQIWDFADKCKGMSKMYSCVYGVADLVDLVKKSEIMAHKLYLEFEPATYYCLAELHYNRTMFPELYEKDFNVEFYRNLPAVKYQNLVDKSTFQC